MKRAMQSGLPLAKIVKGKQTEPNPTKTPGPTEQDLQPTLPCDSFQLGENLLLNVTHFHDQIKIHIRKYVIVDNRFKPTKDGITLSPSRWFLLSEALDSFECETPFSSQLLDEELFISTIDGGVNLQYAHATTRKTIQLSIAHLHTTLNQFNVLREIHDKVAAIVRDQLVGPVFKNCVYNTGLFLNQRTEMNQSDAEEKLRDSLTNVFKNELAIILNALPVNCVACKQLSHNQEACVCNLQNKTLIYFNKAVSKIDIPRIAETFVTFNLSLHNYITETFLNNIEIEQILDSVFNSLI